MPRKALSKKLRFDVFKRDGFKCQYCGVTPTHEVLQVDHIIPVIDGGENEIDNLITSCQPCNLGKGAKSLNLIPESLKIKSQKIAEQEKQIIEYQKIIFESRYRKEEMAWNIAELFDEKARDGFPKTDFESIKMFLDKLPFEEVLNAADISNAKTFYSSNKRFKYFCGICWNKIRNNRAE